MTGFQPYTPTISSPYPDDWHEVKRFEYKGDLYLARAKEPIRGSKNREAQYLVYGDYVCTCDVDGKTHEIHVPSGMLTDLSSVPALARSLVGRVGPHLEASIVHDFLFVAWQDMAGRGARRPDFDFANAVMNQAMIKAGMSGWRRRLIMLAVTSGIAWRFYRDECDGTRYVRVPKKSP